MKKILSFILTLCVLLSMLMISGTLVSAETYDEYTDNFISKMSNDKTSYFTIMMNDIHVEALKLAFWIEENNLLPDVSMCTEEYAKQLEADYLQYVADERVKLMDKNQQFFDANFNADTDTLIYNSDSRGMIVVNACKESVLKLKALDNVYIHNPTDNKNTYMSFAEINEQDYNYPTEPFMDSYELIYALEFYKDFDVDEPEYLYNSWSGYADYMYVHLYNHYPNDASSVDEATPDYALVFCGNNICSPAYSAGAFGDKYLLQEYNIYYPYTLGYHIYVPETMTFLTLREAWDMGVDGIEDVFEDYGLGYIRGDSNFDGEINIKDATFIQKCLAGIEDFSYAEYVSGFSEQGQGIDGFYGARVSDINLDTVVNIKDVTAIQKLVAGIPIG